MRAHVFETASGLVASSEASNQQPLTQLTFYYRRFVPSISWVEPLRMVKQHCPAFQESLRRSVYLSNNGQNFTGGSDATFQFLGFTYFHLHPYLGPISGNTTVLVESATVPVGASASIRCRFGTLTVPGVRVNETYLQCVSPAVSLLRAAAPVMWRSVPRREDVFGYGFLNSTGLNCSFEWIGSPSVVFISSSQIMCEVPNMLAARSSKALGQATLRVTLNNRDWSRTTLSFRFLGECPIGHYCQHKSAFDFTFRILPCPVGHFCESAGMSTPTPCPPGTYMAFTRQVQCQLCPKGFWCPRARMINPIACRRGWVCDEDGLVVPYKRCPRGYYCEEGVASRDSRTQNPKPGNYSTPQPCYQGFFCPPASSTPYGAGACPLGRYCPTPRHAGIVCPERYMCGPYPGNTEPVACPAGSFNPWQGQWNCTVCLEGGVCPHSRLRLPIPCPCGYECRDRGTTRAQNLCPAGLMCDEGVATNIEPQLCEPKTFDIRVDTSLTREREKICVYGIGQQFVDYQRLLTVPRVAERFGWGQDQTVNGTLIGRAACCWSPELLQSSFTAIAAEFKAANDTLSSRSFARLSSEIQSRTAAARDLDLFAPGFDGLTLLNITDEQFREDLIILYPKARQWLHHYIEKLWNFKRPLPCPSGAYCNEGTCPRYLLTGVVDVDFNRPSSAINEARRLAETHYSEVIYNAYLNRTRNVSNFSYYASPGEEPPTMSGNGTAPWNGSADNASAVNFSERWEIPSDCVDCMGNQTEHIFLKPKAGADDGFQHLV
eukprot:g8709.t1